MRGTLYIMLKEPRPGRVKTRLGREIGNVPAAWWFRHQSTRLIRVLGRDPRWRSVLALSPDSAAASPVWDRALPRVAQGRGDLGARMARLLRGAPPGPALIVGGDIPDLGPAHVAQAFAALGRADAVIGPASDGGYWCIGLRHGARLPPRALDGVRWSTRHARADTQARLPGLRIACAAELTDIDTAADLAADRAARRRTRGQ